MVICTFTKKEESEEDYHLWRTKICFMQHVPHTIRNVANILNFLYIEILLYPVM
jgi:hypothetical protein